MPSIFKQRRMTGFIVGWVRMPDECPQEKKLPPKRSDQAHFHVYRYFEEPNWLMAARWCDQWSHKSGSVQYCEHMAKFPMSFQDRNDSNSRRKKIRLWLAPFSSWIAETQNETNVRSDEYSHFAVSVVRVLFVAHLWPPHLGPEEIERMVQAGDPTRPKNSILTKKRKSTCLNLKIWNNCAK